MDPRSDRFTGDLGPSRLATRNESNYSDEALDQQNRGLLHSDTQFDSSADETVVPFMIGERQSQEYLSAVSVDQFDPDISPSHISRCTRRSIDTDACGTLYEETVMEIDHNFSRSNHVEHQHGNQVNETERLVSPTTRSIRPSHHAFKTDYRIGSCYHCLVSIPVGSLLSWILLFISTIGWAVATWMSMYKGKDLLKLVESADALTYEEIVIIVISIATVTIAVLFLVVATFTSQNLSRYSFNTSRKNKFGYCLSLTVVTLSFLCVVFWTAIISLTMIPISALSVIHFLMKSQGLSCLHMPSYGLDVYSARNGTISVDGFVCGDDLNSWWELAWQTLIPLLISLALALSIEMAMLGFLIAASSNARHLRERMEYINEPYMHSAENLNGDVKAVTKDNGNNNLTDTSI